MSRKSRQAIVQASQWIVQPCNEDELAARWTGRGIAARIFWLHLVRKWRKTATLIFSFKGKLQHLIKLQEYPFPPRQKLGRVHRLARREYRTNMQMLEQHPVPVEKPPRLGDSEQGAVSVGLPTQAAAEGALLQLRNLNFLQSVELGSQTDHMPHSAQEPAVSAEKKMKEQICHFLCGNPCPDSCAGNGLIATLKGHRHQWIYCWTAIHTDDKG